MPRAKRTCTYKGCPRPHLALGYCASHYHRWRRHGDPSAGRTAVGTPLAERFWPKVQKGDGCWPWTGAVDSKGYGRFDHELAHRVAWTLAVGPIPPGMNVCHHCDNPPCCNYERCLFLGTQGDNARDMTAKGRHWRHQQGLSPTCGQGHLYTEANTYWHPSGRQCRECQRIRKRRRREAKRSSFTKR